MLRRIATAVALTLALAGPAGAVTLQGQNADVSQYQQWADQSAIPTWPGVVRLTIGGADGECGNPVPPAIGCSNVSFDGVPQIWITPQVPSFWPNDRQTLYHELGQVFDFMYGNPAMFGAFAQIWGVSQPQAAWWTPSPALNPGPLGEWWAEGYRACADGVKAHTTIAQEAERLLFGTVYGYPGGLLGVSRPAHNRQIRKQRMVCDLIREMAASPAAPSGP